MTEDARFEDARERPVRLRAMDAEDLQVVSTLVQDAIFPITEMAWHRPKRRFGLLLNRFRWEDRASREGRSVERVQSVLAVEDVTAVRTNGIDRSDLDLVLSLLSISVEPGDDGAGRILLTLAGDGAIAIDVEALEVTLEDVTRPYAAPSGHVPRHEE
ncbi:Protein of unknown function (DUF2948) [Palleronia aestuarii]|uniref:DUF2948 family protein n=1 Tax=Palleronia aestuarii TaxID=568105 RepID=A0A2W7MTJ7_9RHOB|nr:DUF2948 family protein [Palleronia aestuarii]PZX10841.1 Protein of unknown function (DUF2948) [Palleronia aestuarii]